MKRLQNQYRREVAKVRAVDGDDAADEVMHEWNEDPPDVDDGEAPDEPRCLMCGGPLVSLGALGAVPYFRCRACGSDHRGDVR